MVPLWHSFTPYFYYIRAFAWIYYTGAGQGIVSSEWLEEVEGMARGAGGSPYDILMLNCLPPAPNASGNNCSTFIEIGEEYNRLFKIRDELNRVQSFHTYTAKNGMYVQIGRDIGNIGAAHAVNSKGLAGANNTGSKTSHISGEPVFNDCHMLRFILENAWSVD